MDHALGDSLHQRHSPMLEVVQMVGDVVWVEQTHHILVGADMAGYGTVRLLYCQHTLPEALESLYFSSWKELYCC